MLTGVLNKQSLYETAKYVLTEKRGKSSLLFIDIDNFKYVNDTLGHAFGDQLIVKVGERIRSILDKGYSLYRLGGDEFVLLIEDISGIEMVESFALNILDDFKKGFEIDKSIFYISISIGIVMYPEHGDSLDQLLKYADIAMYQAKEQGKKKYVIFNELMNTAFKERVEIEKYIHRAMEKDEFEVYYQPQIDTKNKRITGMEALLRWNSLELGEVTPQKFIKVAEDTHYIIPLGTWVLRKACAFLKELRMNGYNDLTVSVNISILQLLQYDFCDLVANTIEEYKVPPQLLELEITETILIESFETINPTIKKIHDMKVRIALDDFGKGYSSLNYLEQLPIDTLKVDKSFIDQITDKEKITLTGHIIMLGKDMGMSVVAEGVEQKEQVDYLLSYNCDKIQGFLYSKALSEKEILELLAEQTVPGTVNK
jgi:diguanylate cyclase (GGDEF)-like protein